MHPPKVLWPRPVLRALIPAERVFRWPPCLPVADPRVGEGIGNVDQQIGNGDDGGVEKGRAHDHAVVTGEHALDEEPADTGDREKLLDDERAGYEGRSDWS